MSRYDDIKGRQTDTEWLVERLDEAHHIIGTLVDHGPNADELCTLIDGDWCDAHELPYADGQCVAGAARIWLATIDGEATE